MSQERAKGSGVQIDQPFAMLWKVRAGEPVFGQTFTDHGEEVRAAGLPEQGSRAGVRREAEVGKGRPALRVGA